MESRVVGWLCGFGRDLGLSRGKNRGLGGCMYVVHSPVLRSHLDGVVRLRAAIDDNDLDSAAAASVVVLLAIDGHRRKQFRIPCRPIWFIG